MCSPDRTRVRHAAGNGAATADDAARRHEPVQLLRESAAAMLTADCPDALLRAVFERLGPEFGIDAFFNYCASDRGAMLRLASSAGVADADLAPVRELPLGAGVDGVAARDGQPRAVSSVQASDDPAVAAIKRLGLRAYACCPLIADGRVLGTLSFASCAKDQFSPEELACLQTIASYVTAAYERARLLHALRDAERRKDEFLAALAHELRNPLAPITNALEIMRVTGSDAVSVQQAARTMIERQLGQMVQLIDGLLDATRPGGRPAGVARARPQTATRRVLVADDNRDAAESMGMLLRLMGNEVRTVHDGVQAVEQAAIFRPDLIFLDIGMPGLDGYDAARRIRAERSCANAMLVALTGWGQEEDKRRASEAGFDRHFTKPVTPTDLERLIAEAPPD